MGAAKPDSQQSIPAQGLGKTRIKHCLKIWSPAMGITCSTKHWMECFLFTAAHHRSMRLQLLLQCYCPPKQHEYYREADQWAVLMGLDWQQLPQQSWYCIPAVSGISSNTTALGALTPCLHGLALLCLYSCRSTGAQLPKKEEELGIPSSCLPAVPLSSRKHESWATGTLHRVGGSVGPRRMQVKEGLPQRQNTED